MALLSLNHDVLYEILAQTDSQSALRLSMVSRKAYDLGIPQALSNVTLSRSQQQVSTFCRFVLQDPKNRLSYLRELTIESTAFGVARHIEFQRSADLSASTDLAELLEQAYRLRRVSIACFEDLIAKEPRIGVAVCGLPNLVDVGLHNCGQLSMALLPSLRSRPRKLAFTILFNKKLPTFFHRLVSLDNLESLELSYLDLSDGSQPHFEIHEIPCMPSLRSLSLRGSTARMSLFVRAMPNLQYLRISDVYSRVDGDTDHLKEGCWPTLIHLRGNVPDFRYWKVACPVRWLQLDLTAYHYYDAVDIISRNSPVILSLPVETKVDGTFWTRLADAAPRLRYLEVCLDEGKVQKLETWMRTIPHIISALPLAAIFLCVRNTQLMGSRISPTRPDAVGDIALNRLRDRMMASVPTLEYIGLAIASKGENPFEGEGITPSWWRVTRVGGMQESEAVPFDIAATLREQLLRRHYDLSSHSQT